MAVVVEQKTLVRALRNYLVGQVVGFSRDETLLDELLKCAFCFRRRGPALGLADNLAEAYAGAFEGIKANFPGLFAAEDRVQLGGEHLEHVHAALSQIDFDDPDRDIVGDIYEAFIGSHYRGQEGQFFTPFNAVRTLVEIADPNPDDEIIDPACGGGAFLLQAGLYAAQKNGGRIPALFGVDKDAYLARLARIHLALQFNRPFPIECADSLAWSSDVLRAWWDEESEGRYSLVLTNPPFGSRIVALSGDRRHEYALAHKWTLSRNTGLYEQTGAFSRNAPPQVLFLERCLRLLCSGGRLGIVLPESVLSNPSHRYVVQYLLSRSTPEAVLGMPEALFKISGKGGTHTKVCLLVVRKGGAHGLKQTFMAEAKWCGHDSRRLSEIS